MAVTIFNSKNYPRWLKIAVVIVFCGLAGVQFSSEFYRNANSFWGRGNSYLTANSDKTAAVKLVSSSNHKNTFTVDKRYELSSVFIGYSSSFKLEVPCFCFGNTPALSAVYYVSANLTAITLRGPPVTCL